LGRRPYPWDKRIAKDRFPQEFIYAGMYSTKKWENFTDTKTLWEQVHVARANDPGLWSQFFTDPCLGAPCKMDIRYIGHGVTQKKFGRYRQEYRTSVFCLDQLNSIEEAPAKLDIIVAGYKNIPEEVAGGFIRQLSLVNAGTTAEGGGLYLAGLADSSGNPVAIDFDSSMLAISHGGNAGTDNGLFINLNANGALDALVTAGIISAATTAGLVAKMGQLTMEYLANQQEDLAIAGYHDQKMSTGGKFEITMDGTTSRNLTSANPALTALYKATDFTKTGQFYGLGVQSGCGDWLFKRDNMQMRFAFRADLDGESLASSSVTVTRAVWLEQVQPFENVAATFGIKPRPNARWKSAPVRLYHCYNRDAREVYVGDITSVNSEMKFGLARSFMGKWSWKHPDYFQAVDPLTGTTCTYDNVKQNQGFFLGEYDLGCKTVYPNIERWIMALGEATPYVRRPNTVTPVTNPASKTDYQALLAYNAHCADNPTFWGDSNIAEQMESDYNPLLPDTD
jgi:hypothetical protein